jgi:hypothetical protein
MITYADLKLQTQQKGDKYGKMETDWHVLRYERRRKREKEKTC